MNPAVSSVTDLYPRQVQRHVVNLLSRHFFQFPSDFAARYVAKTQDQFPFVFGSDRNHVVGLDSLSALVIANACNLMERSDGNWFELICLLADLLSEIHEDSSKRDIDCLEGDILTRAECILDEIVSSRDSTGTSLLEFVQRELLKEEDR